MALWLSLPSAEVYADAYGKKCTQRDMARRELNHIKRAMTYKMIHQIFFDILNYERRVFFPFAHVYKSLIAIVVLGGVVVVAVEFSFHFDFF